MSAQPQPIGHSLHPEHAGGMHRQYKLKKDKIDPENPLHHLHTFAAPKSVLPTHVDLRPHCPDVYNQLDLGSCTANAIAAAYEYDQIRQKETGIVTPSRLFVYYNERALENSTSEDAGAAIADGVNCVHTIGVCNESPEQWPYDITKFTIKPPQNLYDIAAKHKTGQFKRIAQNLTQIKTALAQGLCIVFGITVYESFESETVAQTGNVPMPQADQKCLGGHAIVIVGFDDAKKVFIVRNSWGDSWGDKGYCYFPYQYILDPNLSSDFWAIINVIDQQ